MYTKISELLDVYVKMSGEKLNIDELIEEMESLDKSIPKLNDKIDELSESMTDEKYYDASSELIDRNIEISLKKKISYLNNELKKLKEKNNSLIETTTEEETSFDSLHKKINACQDFINELNEFDKTSTSSRINELIQLENDRYDKLVVELNQKMNQKEKSSLNSGEVTDKIAELEKKLAVEEERLDEIKKALESKSSYVNAEAKDADLSRLDDLKEQLAVANKRREEIVTSITFECELIKDLILNSSDKEEILNRVRFVANKLNDLPYLNVEDETMLNEEIAQLNSKKEELTAVIENKKYNLQNSRPYELRLEYLNQKTGRLIKLKEEYQNILNLLTHNELDSAVDNLVSLKEEKTAISNAMQSGEKSNGEKKQIDDLIGNYENDLSKVLDTAKKFREYIKEVDAEIDDVQSEMNRLDKNKDDQFEVENQAEREQDSRMLQDTLKNIEYVTNRLVAKMTPNQVLDQIEMLLFESKDDKPTETKKSIIRNYNLNNEFSFEKVPTPEEKTEKPEEMIVSPDSFIKTPVEETREFSFSPIDNTGFVSFNEAYDSTK